MEDKFKHVFALGAVISAYEKMYLDKLTFGLTGEVEADKYDDMCRKLGELICNDAHRFPSYDDWVRELRNWQANRSALVYRTTAGSEPKDDATYGFGLDIKPTFMSIPDAIEDGLIDMHRPKVRVETIDDSRVLMRDRLLSYLEPYGGGNGNKIRTLDLNTRLKLALHELHHTELPFIMLRTVPRLKAPKLKISIRRYHSKGLGVNVGSIPATINFRQMGKTSLQHALLWAEYLGDFEPTGSFTTEYIPRWPYYGKPSFIITHGKSKYFYTNYSTYFPWSEPREKDLQESLKFKQNINWPESYRVDEIPKLPQKGHRSYYDPLAERKNKPFHLKRTNGR